MSQPTRTRAALAAGICVAVVASVVAAASATANSSAAPAGLKAITSSTSTTTSTTTTSGSPTDDPGTTYADIYVALDSPPSSGPMEFGVSHVVVGPGPELSGVAPYANPSEFCGDAYVDIDPTTHSITFSGAESPCAFLSAYVEVTLYNDTFTSVSVTTDTLFSNTPAVSAPGRGTGPGGLAFVRLATPPLPALVTYGVSGNTFTGSWVGTVPSAINGAAVFRVAFGSDPAAGAGAGARFTG